MEKERNYGIDLFRIVAMYMIIILHICGHGGILASTSPSSCRFWFAWFVEIAAYCAVDCYALASGYVGVDANYNYTRIGVLWLRVIFYTILITAVCSVVYPGTIGREAVVNALFPVMRSQYWYFRCYFFVFFLIPILNVAVIHIRKEQFIAILIGLLGIYSVLQTIFQTTIFGTGYNELWLMILYLLGAGVKKLNLFGRITVLRALGSYIALIFLAWMSKMAIHFTGGHYFGITINEDIFISYYSPMILFSGVFLLLCFRQLVIPKQCIKIIRIFSPLTFGVYLIHEHPFVRNHLIQDRFAWLTSFSSPILVLGILGSALGVFLLCSLIDWGREALFRFFNVRKRIGRLEDRLFGAFWRNGSR